MGRRMTEMACHWVSAVLLSGLDVIVSSWGWDNLVLTIVSFAIDGEELAFCALTAGATGW
jgi:hypothetical protein